MKVVVTGLSSREEAAFGIFLGRTLKRWSWQSAAAGRAAVLPSADIFVVDLVSLGLARWSEANEADLLRLLQDSPAVLLVPSHDRTWAGADGDALKQPRLVWLSKPYGTADMQGALEQAAAAVRRPAESAPLNEAPGLTAAELQARLERLPEAGRHVFLRKLAGMLSREHPFEARFTVQNSLIVHPCDGWVATNTPMLVIERVCQSDALASAVDIREIEGVQAEERMERLGMHLLELDAFLWELVAATLDKKPVGPAPDKALAGSVTFQFNQ